MRLIIILRFFTLCCRLFFSSGEFSSVCLDLNGRSLFLPSLRTRFFCSFLIQPWSARLFMTLFMDHSVCISAILIIDSLWLSVFVSELCVVLFLSKHRAALSHACFFANKFEFTHGITSWLQIRTSSTVILIITRCKWSALKFLDRINHTFKWQLNTTARSLIELRDGEW